MAKTFDEVLGALADNLMAEFAATTVRPMTVHLIWSLLLDLPLTPGQCNDFGVASPDHYRALRQVVEAGEEIGLVLLGEALDRALGKGPALTQLVHKYAPQYQALRFTTPWDELSL